MTRQHFKVFLSLSFGVLKLTSYSISSFCFLLYRNFAPWILATPDISPLILGLSVSFIVESIQEFLFWILVFLLFYFEIWKYCYVT